MTLDWLKVVAGSWARAGLSGRRLFGGLAILLERKMFAGVQDDTLMAQVDSERHAGALTQPHVRPKYFTGRPLSGYVHLDPSGLVQDEQLSAWGGWCADHAARSPDKKPRAKVKP